MARVLVADDEKSIRKTLRAFLEREGHAVETAEHADEALKKIETHEVDVAVADIIMPKMDGLELLAAIRKRKPDVEVVLITGEPNVDTAVAALREGAFDYLDKPLSGAKVCRVVDKAAEAKALKEENRRLAEDNLRHAERLEELVEERTAALRETTRELASYQEQLRVLASKLALAEEQERRRIAIDLHDVAAQNLALAVLKLRELQELAEGPGQVEALGQIRSLVEATALELRSLSLNLSPPMLYEIGLEAALESLARRFEEERGIPCRFEEDGKPKPLETDARTTLYRCAAELLTNAARHAEARRVGLTIGRSGEHVGVVVSDDGKGFEVSEAEGQADPEGGFGLFSIRERMRALRGQLRVESQKGYGTRATLLMPIAPGRQHGTEGQK